MNDKIITVEADSLEDVRKMIKSQIPEGFFLFSEEVVSDGNPKTIKALGETIEVAFAEAQKQIQPDAIILAKREISATEKKVVIVDGFDELEVSLIARSQARKLGYGTILKSTKLVTKGKKGILGVGAKPNQYEIELLKQAIVEVVYKSKAKITAKIEASEKLNKLIESLIPMLEKYEHFDRLSRYYRHGEHSELRTQRDDVLHAIAKFGKAGVEALTKIMLTEMRNHKPNS